MTQLSTKDIELLNRGLSALEQIVKQTAPMLKALTHLKSHLPDGVHAIMSGDLDEMKRDMEEMETKFPERIIRLKAKLLDIRDEVLVEEATKAAEVPHAE